MSSLPLPLDLLGEPLKPLDHALPTERTSGLHIPLPPQILYPKPRHNILGGRIRQINLIREDQQRDTRQPLIGEHLPQRFLGQLHPLGITTIHDIDDRICIVEVEAPEIADFGLASDIPDVELEVLEADLFDVEADGRHGADDLVEFELVEEGGFAGAVQADQDDPGLLGPEAVEHVADSLEEVSHGLVWLWIVRFMIMRGRGGI